jgi:hypothetical protein
MSRKVKVLSERNQFYISKNRQKELEYFVKQYKEWKAAVKNLDNVRSDVVIDICNEGKCYIENDKQMINVVFKRALYLEKIELVDNVAREVNDILAVYLIDSFVSNRTWEYYDQRYHIDCGRGKWYELRREFLWRLDGRR